MFEKEAENYADEQIGCGDGYYEWTDVEQAFKDGAEFGYNKANKEIKLLKETHRQSIGILVEQIEELHKANEWHYVKDGEYPKEYKDILICFLTEDDMKDCVRGWYEYDSDNDKHIFKYLNVLGTQYLETVIAWKEIVLPELKEIK